MYKLRALFLCATILAAATRSTAGDENPSPADQLASLSWLEGSWVGPHERGQWEASYTSAEGGLILSANKEIVGGRVVMIEFEMFAVDGAHVVMTPYPGGRKSPVSFRMVENDMKKRRAVFTNPKHDFPQRIVYERRADDRLVIEVQGQRNGKSISMTLDLRLKQ